MSELTNVIRRKCDELDALRAQVMAIEHDLRDALAALVAPPVAVAPPAPLPPPVPRDPVGQARLQATLDAEQRVTTMIKADSERVLALLEDNGR